MSVQSYLFFEGRADEAIAFYGKALDAELLMRMTYGDSPEGDGECPGGFKPPADKVMHAGLRIGEALQVKAADIAGHTLTVYGKGGKVRRVPLGKRVRGALREVTPQPGGHLFHWSYSQAAYRMRKACTAAGRPGFWRGFHAARKASGTRLYQKVGDFTRVAVFLGHSSVDTTRKYVAVMDDDVSAEVEDF